VLSLVSVHARLNPAFSLSEVSFDVAPGSVVALLGPSGSGKTTVLRLVAGLERPDRGVISWDGVPWWADNRLCVPPEERGVGLLFQEGVLFPHLGVRGNVELAVPCGLPPGQGARRVEEALRTARADGLVGRAVPTLSGGEQQRVGLARALAQRPRVLLLDEPFHSLDGTLKRAVLEDFRRVTLEAGLATLLVTHDAQEAAAMADRVVVLREGRVAQQGKLQDLYREPVDGWVARVLGPCVAVETGEARGAGIQLPPGPHGHQVLFRPEDVELTPVAAPAPVVVHEARPHGPMVVLTLLLPSGTRLEVHARAGTAWQPGQGVGVTVTRVLCPAPQEVHLP
jgi:ABC-type sulfate/molybdate transport systems ATPase subunit